MAKPIGMILVLMLAAVRASATASPLEKVEDEVRREATLHLAREPLTREQIRDLSAIHDVIALEKLDEAWRLRLELRQSVGRIAPRELDEELVETLLGIEKLEPDLAEDRAREMLEQLPPASSPASISRLVLARRGDISVIREALTHYFEETETWGKILSEAARSTDDPRLRDFSPPATPQVAPISFPLYQTVLERTFAGSREKWKLGELLFWAERSRSLVVARLLSHMPEGTLHEEWVSKTLSDFAVPLETAGGSPTDAARLRSLAALGWRGSKSRAAALLRAVDGDEPLAAAVSALALGRMGLEETHPLLREKALSDEPNVASAAVAALMKLGGKEEALDLFERRTNWSLLTAIPVLEVLDGRIAADAAVIGKIIDRVAGSEDRIRLLRLLAERDDPTLTKLDLGSHHIDRLFPYLSRSEFGSLRALVLETGVESRGAALAALLLSPTASRAEKMEAAKTLGDAWPEAVSRGGPPVIEVLDRLEFWKRRGKKVFSPENVTSDWIDALSILPGAAARQALEQVGTVEAIEKLARREDRLLALPALSRLKREGDDEVRKATEMILLSLDAPGSSMLMKQRLERPEALRPLVPYSNGTPQAAEVLAAVAVGDDPRPDVQASLFAFYQDRPQDYLVLLDIAEPSAHRRVHSTLALSDDPARLPVLMDVAALEKRIGSRRAALRGLLDAELGRDAFRLHRSAGDPNRAVRFAVAAALVPSGDVWAMRLMMAEMSLAQPWERLAVLEAIRKLPPWEAQSLLEELFWDGTGNAFSNHLLFEMVGGVSKEQEPRAWELVSTQLDESLYALLIAARLELSDAVHAVIERIE